MNRRKSGDCAVSDTFDRTMALHENQDTHEEGGRYRTLFDHSSDAIQMLDGRRIVECNQSALEMYGYTSYDDFLAALPIDLVPERQANGELSEEVFHGYLARVREGHTGPFPWLARRKDGSLFEASVRIFPLPGNGAQFQALIHDLTEERVAARALEYYRSYISLLAEIRKSFYSRSEQEIVQEFLESASRFFQFDKAWYGVRTGFSISPVFHTGKLKACLDVARVDIEPDSKNTFPLVQAVSGNRPVALNHIDEVKVFAPWQEFLEQSGLRSCLAMPIDIRGKIEGGFVFYSVAANAFDESLVDYLTDGVRELARIISEKRFWSLQQRTLKKAKESAEAAAQAKTQFLANMSHEIRTPMTSILGYAEILLRDYLTLPEGKDAGELTREDCLSILADCKRTAQIIQRNAEFLLGILNEILDFSKIEEDKLSLDVQDVELCPFLCDIVALHSVTARKRNLNFIVKTPGPMPAFARTDSFRLKQVLVNLLGNAFKFTSVGEVELTVTWVQEEADLDDLWDDGTETPPCPQGHLIFAVRDTGIGIPASQLPSIFSPFHQADPSTTRRFGGTGLGLAISKRLVDLLGGELSVMSQEGVGSTFTVILPQKLESAVDIKPLPEIQSTPFGFVFSETPSSEMKATGSEAKKSNASKEISPVSSPQPLAGYRILLAEDGQDNQRLFSFMLRKAGAEVFLAQDGELAVKIALKNLQSGFFFSIILMDMQMPVMDGYTATRQLREKGYTGPIVALTAHAMQEERQKCLDAGCDDYATKPILRDALIAAVLKNAKPVDR